MRYRLLALLLFVLTVTAGGCQARHGQGDNRPPESDVMQGLPNGTKAEQIVHADLTGDGREEALVAAILKSEQGTQLRALVLAREGRRYERVFERRVPGDAWEPIQVGRAGAGAPVAAVFAARAGTGGQLGYIVVQHGGRTIAVTLEQAGLFQGAVRFVAQGLLESKGDTDRLLRWTEAGWETEELGSQYEPQLPQHTVTIPYTIDAVRGPMIESPRIVHARVGQHLFLRRMDRGDPSRVQILGAAGAYVIAPDGIIALQAPGAVEVHIEGPAYSGRTLVITVRVEP
jgi:hypothetical protein